MESIGSSKHDDLFFRAIVDSYVKNPRFLRRDWLAGEVEERLRDPDCRFLLLIAEPGAGKSAFIAQLANDHLTWPVYFIRRDQRTPLGDVGAHSFLLQVGYQLAALYPELFTPEEVKLVVEQRIGTVDATGEAVGAEVKKILASPFYRQIMQIKQQVERNQGRLIGIRIGEWVVEPRLLPLHDLQYMALINPASAMLKRDPNGQIVILVDALDELRYHDTEQTLLSWLTNSPKLPRNVRFVLTSRPPDIAVAAFGEKQKPYLRTLTIASQDNRVRTDLQNYIKKLVARKEVDSILAKTEQGIKEFSDKAVEKADGNIGYLDALARGIDQAIARQDDQALREMLALRELPDNIEGLYAFFLHQIKAGVEKQSVGVEDPANGEVHYVPAWPAVYNRILGVLAVAFEPLTLSQIKNLGDIATDWEYLTQAVDRLHQFLDLSENRHRLYHATLPEFLTAAHTREQTESADLYIDPLRWHKRIANYYWKSYHDDWLKCEDRYALQYIPGHLRQAMQQLILPTQKLEREFLEKKLSTLLKNFDWLQAKLSALDVNALIADYNLLPDDENLILVQGMIRLSAHVLVADKTQLAGQLLGRLLSFESETPQMKALLERAKQWKGAAWLRPLTPSLTFPGGTEVCSLSGHSGAINAIVISSDGQFVISASDDNTIKVWDWQRRAKERTLYGHTDKVNAVAITPDGRLVISASNDRTLKVWDWQNGKEVRTLLGHSDGVTAVAVTSDGQYVISGANDGSLKIWDLQAAEEVRTLPGHTAEINAIATIPDGRFAVSVSHDRTIKIWDLKLGVEIRTLEARSFWDKAIAITPDGQYLVAASKVWNLETGQEICVLDKFDWLNHAITLSPDGKHAVARSGNELNVWDLQSGKIIQTFGRVFFVIDALAIAPDGRYVISASFHELKVWDLRSGNEKHTTMGHAGMVVSVAISPDDQTAVSVSKDGRLKIWDLQTFHEVQVSPHLEQLRVIAVTTDGRFVISKEKDGTLAVWHLPSGKKTGTLAGSPASDHAVAITPDGRHAVLALADGKIKIWHLESGTEVKALTGHSGIVWAVAITPDGEHVVSASQDGTLKLWNLRSGVAIRTFEGHSWAVDAVAITSDGRHVVSASRDTTLKIWDLQSGQAVHTLKGHSYSVHGVAVTRDGRHVISVSGDATLRVWNLQNGALVSTFYADGPIVCCAATTNSVPIVAGESLGRLHFLKLEEVA